MITTRPEEPREGRTLTVALALSLMLHLLGALFYLQSNSLLKLVHFPAPRPTQTPEFVTTSASLTLEKRAHPVPHPPPRRPQPPPQQQVARVAPQPPPVVPQPVPKPVVQPPRPTPEPVKVELTRPVPRKTPMPTPVPSPKTLVMRPPVERPQQQTQAEPNHQAQPRPNHLTAQQIAQLQQSFSQTIAQTRNEANPLRVPPATPAAPKRYKVQFDGKFGALHSGEGEYWPVQRWSDRGSNCYYMAYDFVYESGGYEHGNVPWPVCFAPATDPFMNEDLGRLRRTPLPGPPVGWKLPPGAPLGKALRVYFPNETFPDS